jgi:hypothetical protein
MIEHKSPEKSTYISEVQQRDGMEGLPSASPLFAEFDIHNSAWPTLRPNLEFRRREIRAR